MAEPDPTAEVLSLIESGLDREAARRGAATVARPPGGGPMQTIDPLTQMDRLAGPLGAVIAGIRPDQLDLPTPCADFTVRGVLEHMATGATAFAAAYRGEAPGEAPSEGTQDAQGPQAAVGAALGRLVEALNAPGALDTTIAAPFGATPGADFARFIALDGLVHGWDLATATGQPYEPPDDLVAAVDAFARSTLDPLRDGTTFAAAVEAPAGATPIDRLAAYTGRRPF